MNVYVHIPFCSTICSYCDFPKVCYHKSYINKYLNSLKKEITEKYNNSIVETLYVGGGTPSSLSISELKKLLSILKVFNFSDNYEYSMECNIENMSYEKLKLMYEYGINRLSIGVQTNNSKLLKLLNRHHNKKDVKNVIKNAKNIGFKNINIDLIYGIPNETLSMLKNDIKEFLKLDINHISCYSLIIEDRTILKIKGYRNINEDKEYEMYKYIKNELLENGYVQYEISNYAKKGYESKHNLVYWNNNNYLGFGMSAVSYIDSYRYNNTKNLSKYIKGEWIDSVEYVSDIEKYENEMILGLRKIKGVSISDFKKKFNLDINEVFDLKKLLAEKKLIKENNFIRISDDYLYLSNEILINFIGGTKYDRNN